jgi:predicted dehydrogenase
MLNTAVIGAGTMGQLYARAFHNSDIAKLSAIVDIDADRAHNGAAAYAGAKAYTSLAELLTAGGIDAAAVSLPDYAHRETVIALLDAGLHVLCEKPLATSVEDCASMVAEASGSARLMVNYGNRHRPEALALRDVVQSGVLGELQAITMKGNEKLAKTRQLAWRDRTDPTWFLISHLVDFVSWLTDQRFVDVYGLVHGGKDGERLSDAQGALPAETGHTYLATLDGGAAVTLTASWILPAGNPAGGDLVIEIIGSKGYSKVDFTERPVIVYGERADHFGWDLATPDYAGRARGWWMTSCDYFLHCVANEKAPQPDAKQGAETSLVLLAMHESLDSGSRVSVEPFRAQFEELIDKKAGS